MVQERLDFPNLSTENELKRYSVLQTVEKIRYNNVFQISDTLF